MSKTSHNNAIATEKAVTDIEKPGAEKDNVAKARDIAKKLKVKTVFENDKGEYFTSENLAMGSVGGDRKKITPHSF